MRTARLVSRVLALFATISATEVLLSDSSRSLSDIAWWSMALACALSVLTEFATASIREPLASIAVMVMLPSLLFGVSWLAAEPGPEDRFLRFMAYLWFAGIGLALGRLFRPPPAILDKAQHQEIRQVLDKMRVKEVELKVPDQSSKDEPK